MVEIASLNLFKKTEFIIRRWTLDVRCWTFISFSFDQTECFFRLSAIRTSCRIETPITDVYFFWINALEAITKQGWGCQKNLRRSSVNPKDCK